MWYSILGRNQFLVSLYSEVPELKDVRIATISIHDEGRIVAVQFDMPYYADHPPKKWQDLGDNTVSVRVDLSAVREVTLLSGSTDYKATIEIYKEADLVVVRFSGTVNGTIKAESGFIQSVSGYCQ